MTTRLEQLARLKGIALAYDDIWGQPHRASPQALIHLLRAMHVDAHDPAAIEAAIDAHEADRWRRVLPAAWVTDATAPAEPPLRLPESLADATLAWRLVEEGGAVHEGTCRPAGLRAIERGTLSGTAFVAGALPLPAPLPHGYHHLSLLHGATVLASCRLIVAPPRCYLPQALQGEGRVWGATAQLYAVRSERNWGIGDFTDLATLLELWGAQGASVVGVNPLHAKFPHNPAHASPYSPSSRLFLNTLYLDVEAIEDFRESDEARALVHGAPFQARLRELRAADRVDYAGVAALKQQVLELLYAHFRIRHVAPETGRAQAFRAFCDARGEALHRHAMFEALQEHLHGADAAVWGWPVWPEAMRAPDAPAVRRFAEEHAERVGFYAWLQWQAELQLDAVGRRSLQLGLGVGLYQDLAVSVDRGGAEAWAAQELVASGASVGAPPDAFNLNGQDWGLPPLVPQRLAEAAYAPFIDTLRANMRHAGALRIDHVMALMRLYWVPAGAAAADGAYVHYPFDELLAILRLESHRNRCAVIGEDLGTVPPQVRDKLAASGVLSYRLLFFERDAEGDFLPPARYPAQALVAASTHDLPTLAGWWQAADLALRAELGLFPDPGLQQEQAHERAGDRARLLLALEAEGLLPPGTGVNPASPPQLTPALACAVHQYLARTPSKIVLVQLEDVLGVREQINQPGTVDAYPNWQRRLPLALEQWPGDARFLDMARMFERERGARGQAAPQRAGRVSANVPRATYRVQLHREFGFVDATALVPYLAQLGISHLYCSPFLRARAGSRHGYDIVDHNALNPEIGTRAELDALVETLHGHGMGLLMDVVPNHMGVLGGDNAWWLDVLEDGQASSYAEFFDIDWRSADPVLAGRVLLPILGEQYGVVLERGELRLEFEPAFGRFTLVYFEHRLPIDPLAYARLLRPALKALRGQATAGGTAALERLADAFEHLPHHASAGGALRARRRRDQTILKAQLAQQAQQQPALAQAIADVVTAINGRAGERASFDALDALLEAQAYRLAHWRVAADEINYRRFFDINELAALRMERAEVFEATHRLVLALAAEGAVDGLRIDHPDGLADPAGYFERLQQRYAELAGVPPQARPLYVVTEKITAAHEQLPQEWAVHGTTGYRFANVVNALMVDTEAKTRLDRAWRVFVRGEAADFDELSWLCRRLVMAGPLSGELTVLATALLRLAREDRRTRDFTLNSLRRALADVVASFPVYRTYVIDRPSAQDRRFIDWAIGRARRRSLAADASVFDFLRRVLLGRPLAGAPSGLAERYRGFARRLQQYTAPVAAKGIEDTALYRHQRLISLNDVGSDPDMFGLSVAAFHAASRDRSLHWPHTLLATSTHDAKRSEDVRARIDAISEMPAAWRLTTRRWSRLNRRHRRTVNGVPAPTRNDEYLLYQTLVGSLPAGALDDAALADYAGRVDAAMLKSAREAKTVTSWISPNAAYEAALSAFVRESLARREANLFLDDLQATVKLLAGYGALNGIAMAAIKCLSPGVPDLYQGHETIELSLVDPDNRRPVDYARRRALLAEAQALAAQPGRGAALHSLLEQAADGRAKFWTVWRALQLRREREAMLARAEYLPLEARGERAHHVVAFARRDGAQCVIVVATRLFASLGLRAGELPIGTVWGDTVIELPAGALPAGTRLVDVLSGEAHVVDAAGMPLAALLRHLPVAVLDTAF